MITILAQHRKAIAVLLFGIFYGDLAYSLTLYKAPVNIVRVRYDREETQQLYTRANQTSARYSPVMDTRAIAENKYDAITTVAATLAEAEKANIGGPGQPEMSSFQSVNSSNMVDLFTGDFSYNLPLLDVGGYPVNIHYSSGISMDQEASWVGLGWNINPGTISRSMRGLPDDFNGNDSITRIQNVNPNKTVGVNVAGNIEIIGTPLGIGARMGVFHNNYNGWGLETGVNVSINAGRNAKGPLSGSLSIGNNSQTGLDVSPSLSMKLGKEDNALNGSVTIGSNYNSRSGIAGLQMNTEVRQNVINHGIKSAGISSYISFATPSYTPTITMPLTNYQFSFTGKVGGEIWGTYANASIEGYVSKQRIREEDQIQKIPAYGYLYYSKATQSKVLLDFNREKDIAFNESSSPHIAIPQYTYDTYTISGEGTGGMFRPYRGDIGYIYDHAVKTNSENGRVSGDLGGGMLFKGGLDLSNTTASTESGAWRLQNQLLSNIGFAKSDSTFEEVYFRNPGEKAINASRYYQQLGGDSLVRVQLTGDKTTVQAGSAFTRFSQAKPAATVNISAPIRKTARDKRSQVISYLNAADAAQFGLDKQIRSYPAGSNPVLTCDTGVMIIPKVDGTVRKAHHLSEIDVLNADGRRYVYGLPVYNVVEQDVTFAVAEEKNEAVSGMGMVQYAKDTDNTPLKNQQGKDHYYNKDETPAYAHSFLLTGLLSPDYVDIKGDGITEDDLGDGVKFNYTEVYGSQNGYYSWRTPFEQNKANYNEGLKTYNREDKGTYMFGKKEIWYMHSIESKTMIALFKTSNRDDAMAVLDENGGLDAGKKLKKLDSVLLYVKADLVKNGSKARPVKVVHFEYSYELCQNSRGAGTEGKLSLKKIWFTYNGNNKGKLNPYLFYYNPDAANSNLPKGATNPSYNPKKYDRWGNYKDTVNNPGHLNNIDYPYAEQDSVKAATYATAWHLTDIKLPSGGRMHIEFEGDDYGYVQNKRATQLFKIDGFGVSSGSSPQNILYTSTTDCHVVFVDAHQSPITSKADIYNKYLEGIEKIYFKVAVKMPEDTWGSGYEFVPTYGEIANYGTVAGNNNRFWIELKKVNGESPIALAAIQFLRLNLPSKAYPSSELGDNMDLGGAVKILVSQFDEIKNSLDGFGNNSRVKEWCKETMPDISFVRLDNPMYKKYGGGLRVKRVQVFDNWNRMTTRGGSTGLKESVYGQEYLYTATKEVNGKKITISSGVAAYEPMIGGEENVFHTPIEYIEKVAPMAPTNYTYTETPLGESFFPSPMVGYSKVRVRTINAKAKSANGWEETEFFTSKDFPTITEFTPLDGDSKKRYNPALRNFLRIDAKHYLTLSQGFKVELNDMNGKMKSQANYPENDSLNPITYTANYYKVDDDRAYQKKLNNSVWTIDSANGAINTQAEIGKEVEIMVDVRQQVSTTFSASLSPNLDVIPGFIIPIPIITAFNAPQHEENRFRSIAVMKIVQRYGILDSVVVVDKGSVVSTKNIVYDGETGGVLLSRTNNEFNDPVYNFSYPAHWAYSGMGMAYQNIDAVFKNKNITGGILTERDGNSFPVEKFFESGDEVYVTPSNMGSALPLESDCVVPYSGPYTNIKLWVMDAAKGLEKKRGLYFIDKEGLPYSGSNINLRILRSGKRNFTDVSVGGITSLASPVRLVSDQYRLVIDSNTRVINASAAVFNDLWKVENTLYQADSCTTTIDTMQIINANPIRSGLLRFGIWRAASDRAVVPVQNLVDAANKHFTASVYQKQKEHNDNGLAYLTRSIIKFDLTSISPNATILSASLSLHGYKYNTTWRDVSYLGGLEHEAPNIAVYSKAHYLRGANPERGNDAILSTVREYWNDSSLYYHMDPPPDAPDRDIRQGIARVPIHGAPDDSCSDRTVDVTSLINEQKQDTSFNQGILIRLANEARGPSYFELRTLSFCGEMSYSGEGLGQTGCENCIPPTLNVTYSVSKDTCYKVCRYNIKDSSTNPYRWGILGNWRMDRAYTYYHERKEADAATTVSNIRTEGELKNFIPYWQFNTKQLLPAEDTMRWVWNSAISQYNRKGFEIENYDPLNRYNSGLYGYKETLPVAVIQNSRHRESLFDGFEDYSFQSQNCDLACPTPRPIDFLKDNPAASVQDSYSHSGRYSIAVANGQAVLTMPVITDSMNSLPVQVSMPIDTSLHLDHSIVTGKGTGLTATYSCFDGLGTVTRKQGPLDLHFAGSTDSMPNCHALVGTEKMYTGSWTGKIQPLYLDNYTFQLSSEMTGAGLRIVTTDTVQLIYPSGAGGTFTSSPIFLSPGTLYTIIVDYPAFTLPAGAIQLSWSSRKYQNPEVVPAANLYPADMVAADSAGSVNRHDSYCVYVNAVQPRQVIQSSFSPVQGSKLVVSAWINANPANCIAPSGSAPAAGEISVGFNAGSPGTTVKLLATGVSIEGWQRYEGVVTVPAAATQLYLTLKSVSGQTTYFDDVRVHPYNANMKSFVYDPVSLRLMAELDENNYATFYEYDDDGTLIRVKKETEKGIQTIKESRSALFKEE